jgi:hypothetical protein
MRALSSGGPGEIVRWLTTNGVVCISSRREPGRPFEIRSSMGTRLIRSAFHSREQAAMFALAARYKVGDLWTCDARNRANAGDPDDHRVAGSNGRA